jgi:DNA polymerase III subunit beta
MESSIKCKIQAHVEEEGEATVPAGPFATLVPELPDVEIFIWLDDDENVHIEAEKTRYRLQTMSPEDFPSWSDFEPLTSFVLEQKVLKEMIDKTLFAIPPKDPRKVLLGGLLIVDKQFPEYMNIEEVENPTHLRLVATDGKKLSYVDAIASNVVGQDETRSIIPLKILSEIHKLLRDEGVVKIGLGEKKIIVNIGDTEIKSNMIDGEFPNYEMVIPKDFEYKITLDKKVFADSIKRAAILSETQSNSILLKVSPGEIELSAMTFDLGSFQGSFPVDYDGDKFEMAFSYKYLVDVMHVVSAPKLSMHIKAPNLPVIFHEHEMIEKKSEDGKIIEMEENIREEILYLVMPIKVKKDSDE